MFDFDTAFAIFNFIAIYGLAIHHAFTTTHATID
jgi:hypothetical protein